MEIPTSLPVSINLAFLEAPAIAVEHQEPEKDNLKKECEEPPTNPAEELEIGIGEAALDTLAVETQSPAESEEEDEPASKIPKIKLYKCKHNGCDYTCKRKDNLTRHEKAPKSYKLPFHPEKPGETKTWKKKDADGNFLCTAEGCPYKSKLNQNVNRHIQNTHSH
ncbi:hypothetical protein B4U79_16727 [Dinothrombium tinctorium]|uniref:C2H2-type domain-containing protein n=1 Tax=Dinothrombium tinctorium TaxID=1965070 RepID=A0A443QEM4_9ACAR|nr:hypothetical protein B4U79_16727 [Dinothrombium tinctorium]